MGSAERLPWIKGVRGRGVAEDDICREATMDKIK